MQNLIHNIFILYFIELNSRSYLLGNSNVGQPSFVYEARVDRKSGKYFAMQLIGRGHHSGKVGKIYTDLSEITTAKELVDRVIIEL